MHKGIKALNVLSNSKPLFSGKSSQHVYLYSGLGLTVS